MSRYPNESVARFDQQFAESTGERNERLRERRVHRYIEGLQQIIIDLSGHLTDEGDDWTHDGLDAMRRRVANALPPTRCPEWLAKYRDPAVVRS